MRILIEPHYLGNLEYFSLLNQYDNIDFYVGGKFEKQTYLNRAYFLTANKVQTLIVPVSRASGQALKDARIDYSHRWMKDHWGALYSGYGKAPFFEFFQEEIHEVWRNKPAFLLDLNLEFLRRISRICQLKFDWKIVDVVEDTEHEDMVGVINPKKPHTDRKIYHPHAYTQLFGDTFVSNLSIVDLIMNEGPNSAQVLRDSYQESDQK